MPFGCRCECAAAIVAELSSTKKPPAKICAATAPRSSPALTWLLGSDLEIRIPISHYASRRLETDFATQGRVVHVGSSDSEGERLVGVQFTGPRFQRVFRSESAA